MTMVDIMVPAYNRLEFTQAVISNLVETTEWSHVRKLFLYDVGSTEGMRQYFDRVASDFKSVSVVASHLPPTPVTDVLTAHVSQSDAPFIAKIDNDTIVPPKWLSTCLGVLERHPELDLLGIEAHYPSEHVPKEYGYAGARFIGGIGVFRRRAFDGSRPKGRDTFFGFTEWQDKNPHIVKGWIQPSIDVCLLDRLPFDPWLSLTADYVAKGWQRPWPKYDVVRRHLWGWKWPNS